MTNPTHDELFIGRNDVQKWISEYLDNCQNKGVLLGIHGVGGIGKSAILRQLRSRMKFVLYVDCQAEDNILKVVRALARSAHNIGVKTPRFDIINDTWLWFIEGVEPYSGTNKRWVKELIDWIPTLSKIAKIAIAIKTAGVKLKQLIGRFTSTTDWFRQQLGEEYGASLLQILAESISKRNDLIISSLIEDLNLAETKQDFPFLVLFDSFEFVNDETLISTDITSEIKVTESELWHFHFSRLESSVTIFSGRILPEPTSKLGVSRYDFEIEELSYEECKELLLKRGIQNDKMQEKIIQISKGHPFILNSICDISERGDFSPSNIQDIFSDDFLEVREKTWRMLINQTKSLAPVIHHSAFLPFFDFKTLQIVYPHLDPTTWKDFIRLSIVEYVEPFYRLHELARELALGEYQDNLSLIAGEISSKLKNEFENQQKATLLGLAINAELHVSENQAIENFLKAAHEFSENHEYRNILELCDCIQFRTDFGKAGYSRAKGTALERLNQVGEAEILLVQSLKLYQKLSETQPERYMSYVASTMNTLARLKMTTGRNDAAIELYESALTIKNSLKNRAHPVYLRDYINGLNNLAVAYRREGRFEEAKEQYQEALHEIEALDEEMRTKLWPILSNTLNNLGTVQAYLLENEEALKSLQLALEIREKLAKKNPTRFLPYVSETHHNLGELFSRQGLIDNAIRHFEESLKIRSELSKRMPEQFLPLVAQTKKTLANSYQRIGKIDEAEIYCRDALGHFRELAENNQERFLPYLGSTLTILGFILKKKKNFEETEDVFKEALEIRRKLAEKEPSVYLYELVIALNNISVFYQDFGRHDEAIPMLEEALDTFKNMNNELKEKIKSEQARIEHNLAKSYLIKNRIDESENHIRNALEIRLELNEKSPEMYSAQVGDSYHILSQISEAKGNLDQAIDCYMNCIDSYSFAVSHAFEIHSRTFKRIIRGVIHFTESKPKTVQEMMRLVHYRILKECNKLFRKNQSFLTEKVLACIAISRLNFLQNEIKQALICVIEVIKTLKENKDKITHEDQALISSKLSGTIYQAINEKYTELEIQKIDGMLHKIKMQKQIEELSEEIHIDDLNRMLLLLDDESTENLESSLIEIFEKILQLDLSSILKQEQ